ncbi:uncharacterized protein UBRO_20858 [Ustilago bromivora]|uniref:Uncharacterized protein n=1 Tax=Ustilago bromivora TaxID=307758 RepID=A0A1K0GAE2_9BASI|nr:uncharacterized protein UBRO_20858 [Ustilago bromivora]
MYLSHKDALASFCASLPAYTSFSPASYAPVQQCSSALRSLPERWSDLHSSPFSLRIVLSCLPCCYLRLPSSLVASSPRFALACCSLPLHPCLELGLSSSHDPWLSPVNHCVESSSTVEFVWIQWPFDLLSYSAVVPRRGPRALVPLQHILVASPTFRVPSEHSLQSTSAPMPCCPKIGLLLVQVLLGMERESNC